MTDLTNDTDEARCGGSALNAGLGDVYLIHSKKHTNGVAVWWRPNMAGYTSNINDAGKYSKEIAERCCNGSHGDDVPVPLEKVLTLSIRAIVDMGDGNNRAMLAA